MSAASDVPKLAIEKYQENYFRIFGSETKTYKESLKALGCSWNPHLKAGAGWIIKATETDSIKRLQELIDSVSSGAPVSVAPSIKVGYVVEYEDKLDKVVEASTDVITCSSTKSFSSTGGEWVSTDRAKSKIIKIYVPK